MNVFYKVLTTKITKIMEITLGYGSYCKISNYQEGLESYVETLPVYNSSTYYENLKDDIDY